MAWPRPVPSTGDITSSAERAGSPDGWAFSSADIDAVSRVVAARRDVRRFRPDPVAPGLLAGLLDAAHRAPSVGHSQPWRFVVVHDPLTRQRAATLADRERLAQAATLDEGSGRHLLDLDLEGIREAPVGVVVCCDRRVPASGVLGRATFTDTDLWSCACAIENLWLSARAAGLGVGWVTLFDPADLAALVGAPAGVVTLGWLCIGWPDERPPGPGLERRGWSERRPLADVVIKERWPSEGGPTRPASRLRPPSASALVAARDGGDRLLAPPAALGVLDRVVDRVTALARAAVPLGAPSSTDSPVAALRPTDAPVGADSGGSLVLVAADHPVAHLGVSAYPASVTRHVVEATLAGRSLGAVAAARAGLVVVVVDAGIAGPDDLTGTRRHRPLDPRGDLVEDDALSQADVDRLIEAGRVIGAEAGTGDARVTEAGTGDARVTEAGTGDAPAVALVALGEVGVGNTTVAAALAAVLLGVDASAVVGLGSGADSAIIARKVFVVDRARRRWDDHLDGVGGTPAPWAELAVVGGPELAVLAGVCLGAAEAGAAVVLDGLATSVAALMAVRMEPALASHLVAGQRSREKAHGLVLDALGLEPLLDLRFRAGEGVGACLAAGLVAAGVEIRRRCATTLPVAGSSTRDPRGHAGEDRGHAGEDRGHAGEDRGQAER